MPRHACKTGNALRMALVASTVLLSVATGCSRAPADAAAAPAPVDPATTMSTADLKDVTASFDCGGGNRIDVIRDKVARVALSDGRVVKIERVDGSAPPTFMDNGLTFTRPPGGVARLDDESGRAMRCEPVAKPGAGTR